MTPTTITPLRERVRPYREHLHAEIQTLQEELKKIDPRSKDECDTWSMRVYSNLIESKTRLLHQLYPA